MFVDCAVIKRVPITAKLIVFANHRATMPRFFFAKFIPYVLIYAALTMLHLPAFAEYDDALKEYKAGRHSQAAKLLERAADEGDARAKYLLARMLIDGQGVPKNGKRGFELLSGAFTDQATEIDRLSKKLQVAETELKQLKSEKDKSAQSTGRIGQQVCRSGTMFYVYQSKSCRFGKCVYLNQRLQDQVSDAQVKATIENVSGDGRRIQIRVSGWSSALFGQVDQQREIIEPPMLDGVINAIPGTLTWDENYSWYPCTNM